MYAIPMWWGFTIKGDRQRLEKLLTRLRRWGIPYDFPTVDGIWTFGLRTVDQGWLSPSQISGSTICFYKQTTLYNVYAAFMTSLFACFLKNIRYNLIVSFLN